MNFITYQINEIDNNLESGHILNTSIFILMNSLKLMNTFWSFPVNSLQTVLHCNVTLLFGHVV